MSCPEGREGQQANWSREPGAAVLGGAAERRGLRADKCGAPAMGPFCHLKPLGHLLGYPPGPGAATAQTQRPLSARPHGWGTCPRPALVACQEIYTRPLTAARHRRRVLAWVVRCESAPCEQMKAVGGWAEKRAAGRASGSLPGATTGASSGLGLIRGSPGGLRLTPSRLLGALPGGGWVAGNWEPGP